MLISVPFARARAYTDEPIAFGVWLKTGISEQIGVLKGPARARLRPPRAHAIPLDIWRLHHEHTPHRGLRIKHETTTYTSVHVLAANAGYQP